MSGRIVIGYDGSDSGEDALVLGSFLARATGQEPVVVSVYPEENPIGVGRVDAEWVAFMRGQAREMTAAARAVLDARGVPAEYRTVGSSSAAHGLDDVAEAEQANMIVVGSSRHTPRRRIAPGSTGDRLLHGASCPVAVAPRSMREHPEGVLERVGVAYIDVPEAHEGLRVAVALAQRTGARLRLYSVIARRAEIFAPVAGRDAEEAFLATAREHSREALERACAELPEGVQADVELLEGDVVDELAALDERDIDVLVCGSRSYGPLRRVLLGGVSGKLIRRAACPVIVVPRGAAD